MGRIPQWSCSGFWPASSDGAEEAAASSHMWIRVASPMATVSKELLSGELWSRMATRWGMTQQWMINGSKERKTASLAFPDRSYPGLAHGRFASTIGLSADNEAEALSITRGTPVALQIAAGPTDGVPCSATPESWSDLEQQSLCETMFAISHDGCPFRASVSWLKHPCCPLP